ncbi:hypothetical protein HDE_06383 [Halotydeus destructor]|nr:hypothetical protein HDE_06383 [Halotydeus destructor]
MQFLTAVLGAKAANAFKANVKKRDLPHYDTRKDLTYWGLYCGDNPLLRKYQLSLLTFQWAMVAQWVVLLAFGENKLYLADFTDFLGGSRAYFLVPIIVWSMVDAIFRTFYWMPSCDVGWIGIFDILTGRPTKFLNDRLLVKFWKRCLLIFFIMKIMITVSVGFAIMIQFLPLVLKFSNKTYVMYGTFWAILRGLSTSAMFVNLIGTTCYGYLIMHYFSLRFSTISDEAATLAKVEGHCIRILTFLKLNERFNIICSHLERANRFWKHILTCIYFGFTGCSCLLMYQLVFFDLPVHVFSTYFAFLACNILCQMILFISAAYLAAQSRKIYRHLNKMSLNILPFEVKYKLMATIERVGGEPIGFTCSDLFVVTWDTFYDNVLNTVTYFIMVASLTNTEY